jgi:hypothetical protein
MFDGVEVPAPRTVHPIASRGPEAEGIVSRECMSSDHLEGCALKLARTDRHCPLYKGVKSHAWLVGKGSPGLVVVILQKDKVRGPVPEHLGFGGEVSTRVG